MNCCLLKVPKYFPLSFLSVLISSAQKANCIAAESCIVTESKGPVSSPVCLHTEKMGPDFVTVCPCCLCHFHPKDCVYISSALNLRGKICCPVGHSLQDINPFAELLRFLPLLLAPEKIKKITSKQSEFEDHNRMGLKILILLLVEYYSTKHLLHAQ